MSWLENWWWDFATAISVIDAAYAASDLGLADDDVIAIAPAWVGVPTMIGGKEEALLPAKAAWVSGRLFDPAHTPDNLCGRYVSVRGSMDGYRASTRQLLSPNWSERELSVNAGLILMPLVSVSELSARSHTLLWDVVYPMLERMSHKLIHGVLTGVQYDLEAEDPLLDDIAVEQMISEYVLGRRVARMLLRATGLATYQKVDPYTAMRVAVRRDLREAVYALLGDVYRGSMIRDFARTYGLSDPRRVAAELSMKKTKMVTVEAAEQALGLPRAITSSHSDRY